MLSWRGVWPYLKQAQQQSKQASKQKSTNNKQATTKSINNQTAMICLRYNQTQHSHKQQEDNHSKDSSVSFAGHLGPTNNSKTRQRKQQH